MPEIAEVHFIRKHLVGKKIADVTAQDDANVFGKVGTSAAEFMRNMKNKTVAGAGQQGKYFWLEMSSPPHPVMHFGMTGWFHIKDQSTYYYKEPDENAEWPPRFAKFKLTMEARKGELPVEAAFADARRFGRVRLVDCEATELRKNSPLVENGPDPVIDKDIFNKDFLADLCARKRVPIKALLLDQANISGIGNWVGDEVLFHARIHPEQYANTLQPAQVERLHDSIRNICTTACDLLADSSQFPDTWLFRHRWGKGKKESANQLPSGEKITFLTVGGRTSAVVPSLQRKTGPVAGDVDGKKATGEKTKMAPKAAKSKSAKAAQDESDEDVESEGEDAEEKTKPTPKAGSKRKAPQTTANGVMEQKKSRTSGAKVKHEDEGKVQPLSSAPKRKSDVATNSAKASTPKKRAKIEPETGQRRSGRLSSGRKED